MKTISPRHVLLAVGIGTGLSLMGDASLYAVLPTHTVAAGVSVVSVGALLSANRFIRLALNGPAGMAYDHWPRRPLFLSALFIGAASTAIYGLTQGFWPLLVGRLLWGLAWSGIWVGGNTIILDISRDDTRGRWVGLYQTSFFLGAAGGAVMGGLLTDRLGYHPAMVVGAALTLVGAVVALALLPETRGLKQAPVESRTDSCDGVYPEQSRKAQDGVRPASLAANPTERLEFAAATALYAANRLALAGVLSSTLGLLLLAQMGEQVQLAGYTLGVATLTGLGLGLSKLVSMASAPLLGGLSDRVGNRWRVAAGGLAPGIAGFGFLAVGLPLTTLLGVLLTAITGGSNQGLATAIIGDTCASLPSASLRTGSTGLGNAGRQSRRLGALFTVGDLASAAGPPLAYALIPWIGVRSVYLLSAGLFAAMFLVALRRAAHLAHRPAFVRG